MTTKEKNVVFYKKLEALSKFVASLKPFGFIILFGPFPFAFLGLPKKPTIKEKKAKETRKRSKSLKSNNSKSIKYTNFERIMILQGLFNPFIQPFIYFLIEIINSMPDV